MNMNAISMLTMPKMPDAKTNHTNNIKTNIHMEQSDIPMNKESVNSFERLLGEMDAIIKPGIHPITDDFKKIEPDNKDEIKQQLSELDLDTVEKILGYVKTFKELNTEDLLLVEEMTRMLQELQESGEQNPQQIIELASNQLLTDMMTKYNQMNLVINPGIDVDEAIEIIPFQPKQINQPIEKKQPIEINLPILEKGISNIHAPGKFLDFNEVQKQAEQIFIKVEDILKQIDSKADISRIAPRILELLTEWQQLSQIGGKNTNLFTSLNVDNKQLSSVWQQLVQNFQSRTGMNQRNHYNLDAKVTTTDVVRWLSHAMEAEIQINTEKTTIQPTAALSTMPISKVEQFVIHLNQTQNNAPVDKQLIEQFQKIMDANRITNLQNSRGNLAITLKPANLGEMLVRFTQVNGEMLVKIFVTTAVAKEMLEGNMQQLRNMFSPHQVTIEKQEVIVTQSQQTQKEQNSNEQHDTREEQTHSESKHNQSENDSFASLFEELMLNEKV